MPGAPFREYLIRISEEPTDTLLGWVGPFRDLRTVLQAKHNPGWGGWAENIQLDVTVHRMHFSPHHYDVIPVGAHQELDLIVFRLAGSSRRDRSRTDWQQPRVLTEEIKKKRIDWDSNPCATQSDINYIQF
jgi:hypothetical protein